MGIVIVEAHRQTLVEFGVYVVRHDAHTAYHHLLRKVSH